MTVPFVDTDDLIRLLTGDHPTKQAEAAALFEHVAAGETTVATPDTAVADAVYVLASRRLYRLPRERVRDLPAPLVRLPHFLVANRSAVLRALDLYAETDLDFGDALIIAAMEHVGSTELYSYDKGFDRIPTVQRRQPPLE